MTKINSFSITCLFVWIYNYSDCNMKHMHMSWCPCHLTGEPLWQTILWNGVHFLAVSLDCIISDFWSCKKPLKKKLGAGSLLKYCQVFLPALSRCTTAFIIRYVELMPKYKNTMTHPCPHISVALNIGKVTSGALYAQGCMFIPTWLTSIILSSLRSLWRMPIPFRASDATCSYCGIGLISDIVFIYSIRSPRFLSLDNVTSQGRGYKALWTWNCPWIVPSFIVH